MALKIKSIKPVSTGFTTTANRYESDETSGLIIDSNKMAGQIKEYQTVLAVGSMVREIKPGDVIVINPTQYMHKRNKVTRDENDNSLRNEFVEQEIYIQLPIIDLDEGECLLLDTRDIAYVIDNYEEVPDTPKTTLITPKTPKIIV